MEIRARVLTNCFALTFMEHCLRCHEYNRTDDFVKYLAIDCRGTVCYKEIQENDMARKWKLKQGPKTCNVTVEREGKVVTVKCEEGRIYEGDEFAKWCPSVLVEVHPAVIQSLPVSPPLPQTGKLREDVRPEIRPIEVKGVGIDLKATMEKKHVEIPVPPPTPEPEPVQEPEPPQDAPEPEPEKPREKKGKLRKRGR